MRCGGGFTEVVGKAIRFRLTGRGPEGRKDKTKKKKET